MAQQKAVPIATAATQILAPNTKRISFYVVNNGTQTIFLGDGSDVTVANGTPIFSGGTLNEDQGFRLYKAAVFGIVGSGTGDARVWERESVI